MPVFKNLLGKGKISKANKNSYDNPKLQEIFDLNNHLTNLLSSDSYIAKSSYLRKVDISRNTLAYFQELKDDNLLAEFCKKNKVPESTILSVIEKANDFKTLVSDHNQTFIEEKLKKEKSYLDSILKDIDPNIKLDEDQRIVVLTDEDYSLVIAGAGAGKTTTVAAKVKYLVEKQRIKPEEILVVSFTNKAVGELKEKIQKQLHIECPITTLQDYFRDSVLQNQKLVDDLINFFATYFDAPIQAKKKEELFARISNANFSTLKSEVGDYHLDLEIKRERKKECITIQNEVLRSYEEVQIANFLYLNNIEYEYEPRYKYNIEGAKKPYTPDFIIWQNGKEAYIEHFGITQSGNSNRYSSEELKKYQKAVHDKVNLHKQHGTNL